MSLNSIVRMAFVFAAMLLMCGVSQAQEVADVARGPVDPYQSGFERSRFLAAAGVDTELDETEFKANAEAERPWVRKFDAWAKLKAFDRNKSETIDWFEADAYRKAVRAAVLGQFDNDKNNRLNAAERAEANKLLASGRTPPLKLPSATQTERQGLIVNPRQTQRQTWDLNGDGTYSDEERKAYQEKMKKQYAQRQYSYMKKHDADGDGQISAEERKAYQEEMRQRYAKQREEYVRKHDTDGDGKLSREEQQAAYKARMEQWKQDNPEAAARWEKQQEEYKRRREEQVRKYDANGDGKLTGDEWNGVREEQMQAWKQRDPEGYARYQKRMQDYTDKWDTDGDGKLSQQEHADARKAQYEDWKAKNPEAAKRHEERRKQWEQQRKDGGAGAAQPGKGGSFQITPFGGAAGGGR